MTPPVKGTRKDNPDSELPKPGEYGRDANGDWYGMTPNGHLANLSNFQVTEHPDKTISVLPSIMVRGDRTLDILWHGFLEAGNWRST